MSTACPYRGEWMDCPNERQPEPCGYAGYLCHRCREDRADARTDRLVEGMALAGLLANPFYADADGATPSWYAKKAAIQSATLRGWEGGDG